MTHFVGVDVGGTTCTVAIGDETRNVVQISDQFATRVSEGPEETIRTIAGEILATLNANGIAPERLEVVGLSTPGPATKDGVLLNTPNFDPRLWDQVPFRAALEKKIRERSNAASVHYIGDGQAAALGEYSIRRGTITWDQVSRSNAAHDELQSLFMVAVGTGLGGGEIRGGMFVSGKDGIAGHAGHLFLPSFAFRYEHDQQLTVGNAKSTIESAVSLTALTHQLGYRLSLDAWQDHPLHASKASTRDKAKQLRDLAAAGDPLARELFDDQARALGIGLLSLDYIGNYDLLVIGGGVCDLVPNLREQYLNTVRLAYREFALDGFKDHGRIEFAICGDEAPVIGALARAYSISAS
ncbi:MAG: ROK family protein [Planctomycetota bacterium]